MKFNRPPSRDLRAALYSSIPEANASFLSNEEALVKPVTDKSVAAGQPAPLNANMKPEVQKLIELLKFDPDYRTSKGR